MKIQVNDAEIVDLCISELYDCWMLDKHSFHHWLTRKSDIKFPPEADTGSWFFSDTHTLERSFEVDLKDYIEWWNPLVAYIKAQKVDSYRVVDDSIVYVQFAIYLNNYPDKYWEDEK
jgi:hypothetical protein